MKKLTTDDFIKKAKEIHGNKYFYNKTVYKNMRTKVCITCPEHGDFWQLPSIHLNQKCGCPMCNGTKKRNTEDFIKEARAVHGDKYVYDKTNYENTNKKVCITCPEHGDFWQTPYEHMRGHGCPKCSGRSKLTLDEFKNKSRKIHGDKYIYDKTNYINNSTKVCITCPIHGDFWQTPSEHMRGHGCPKCALEKISKEKTLTTETFIERSERIHKGYYNYDKVKYVDYYTKVCITCPEHGDFWQAPYTHYSCGCGCPKCANQQSKGEQEIVDFLKTKLKLNVEERNKTLISPYELDIYIPDKKVAIEYDGLIWHSEKFGKDKNYHIKKTKLCEEKGIMLFHIFESEWLENKCIVENKLSVILNTNNLFPKIMARKCSIKEVTKKESYEFLDTNHIQKHGSGSVYVGCFYKDELIGVMSFKRERRDSDKWELTRFATDITKHCIGVGGKLFKYFVRNYNPSEVKSFADRRWTLDKNNNLYTKLGFKLDKIIRPDYYYTNGKFKLIHKFNFRKQIIHKKYGLPLTMTENEMADKLGYYKVWNCGLFRYVWKDS